MKTCTACKQTKPLDDFRRSNKTTDGYTHVCEGCSRPTGGDSGSARYIDKDVSAKTPGLSSEAIIRHWNLDSNDLRIARTVAARAIRYRRHYTRYSTPWPGEPASEYVNRMTEGEETRYRVRLLQLGMALAEEVGVDFNQRTNVPMRVVRKERLAA